MIPISVNESDLRLVLYGIFVEGAERCGDGGGGRAESRAIPILSHSAVKGKCGDSKTPAVKGR